MTQRQILINIDDSNDRVTFCELTEKGILQTVEGKDIADEGVWSEWSDWMSADRALKMIEGFLRIGDDE